MELPDGYAMRPGTIEDAPAVAGLLFADDVHDTGRPVYDEDFARDQWSRPGVDPAEDTWIVLGRGGQVIGAAIVIPEGEQIVRSWGVVHPEHRGHGIGATLFELERGRARERLRGVTGAAFHHAINDVDEAARAIVTARGLRFVRSFRHMEIPLDGAQDPGEAPEGITIRGIDADVDLPRAHAIFVDAFRGQWGYREIPYEEWLEHEVGSDFDPTLWLLASDGDEPVGALNGMALGDRGWVGELGVREDRRGRGIATALLRRAFATFAERGFARAMLNVDFDNPTGAVALYEKVGMRVVRGYDVYEELLD